MKNLKVFIVLLFILFLNLFFIKTLSSCTIIAVGKKASIDGSVLVSHTDCCEECRVHVVPSMRFKKGALAPVYWGIQNVKTKINDYGEIIGYIPQVRKTYAYFHTGYPHINEHQLAIGESTLSQRDELIVNRKNGKQIMTVEQAMLFAHQRCKTAKSALDLITSLMEKYGFLPSCYGGAETLAIADTNEVWILELFSVGPGWEPNKGKLGVIWAARRLPDDHVTIIPNWSIIREIDLKNPNIRASKNYKKFAIDKGWYNPKEGKPFIWQEVYSPIPREWATSRFWLFYSKYAPNLKKWPNRKLNNRYKGYDSYHQYVEPLSLYPFSVKPEKKMSVKDIIDFQRSYFEGSIYDMSEEPVWYIPDGKGKLKKSPLATPFPTKDMRELLNIVRRRQVARGGYGMVAQLRGWLPDPIGGIYWFYVDNQYVSTYVPIYVGVQKISKYYKIYDPDKYDENSARWLVDFVDNLLYLKWQEAVKDLKRLRNPLENKFFNSIKKIDEMALKLYKKSHKKAKKYLTSFTNKCMEDSVKLFRELRNVLITKYTNNKQGL